MDGVLNRLFILKFKIKKFYPPNHTAKSKALIKISIPRFYKPSQPAVHNIDLKPKFQFFF